MPLDPKKLDHQKILQDERDGKLDPTFVPLIRDWRDAGQFPPPIQATSSVPPPPRTPAAGRSAGSFDPSGPMGVVDKYVTPETVAGGLSMWPGLGTTASAALGAGTSVAKDLYKGNRDPVSIGTHAALHGAINALPGYAASRGLAGVGGDVANVATGGLFNAGKHWIQSKALGALLHGEAHKAGEVMAPAAMKAAVDDLTSMTLASGHKLVSSEGLKELVQKSVDLENQGAPKMVIDALDGLIKKVSTHLQTPPSQPLDILGKAGIPLAPAAGAASAATKTAGKKSNTDTLASVIRMVTSLESIFGPGGDLTGKGMPQDKAQVSKPPAEKP